MKRKWTAQQIRAIRERDKGILVSAAAGSGKTAVLAARCADIVADEKVPCGVDELLVVTFTESAAAQMKRRIHEQVRRRAELKPTERLARQLALVEHAHVSTLHGFCARLIRQNFNLVDLDPEFRVLSEDESGIMRMEIATELFQRRHELEDRADFQRLIDSYGEGDDQRLIEKVIQTHQLLCSLVDPDAWIERSRQRIYEAANGFLDSSYLGGKLREEIERVLESLERQAEHAVKTVAATRGPFGEYVRLLKEMETCIRHWRKVLRDAGLDDLRGEFRDYAEITIKAPPIKSDTPGKELVQGVFYPLREAMTSGALAELLAFSTAQWQQGLAMMVPHAGVFLDLVREFGQEFAKAKSDARAVDFADMERLSLRILRDGDRPSAVARALHQQFRHVLVDEYQDINEIQDEILRLVSHESTDQPGNLFCVGDVKQSIFRFRLAEPDRFLRRRKKFMEDPELGVVIDLRENFRSRAPLLAAVNAIFQRLLTGGDTEIIYDESQRLQAGIEFPPAGEKPCFPGAPIELHLLPHSKEISQSNESADTDDLDRQEREAIFVARRVRGLLGMDGSPRAWVMGSDNVPRPVEPNDIVILLRAMQFNADKFADCLTASGVACFSEIANGFFDATEVRDMICVLEILDNRKQDIPLAAVLRSPLGGLPNADDALARIRLAYRGGDEDQIPFHEAVNRYAKEHDDELAAKLRDFFGQLAEWRDQMNKRPVAEVLWWIYEQTGYLAYCGGLEDGPQRAANLIALHEKAAEFGTFLRQGLWRFLKFLQNLREQKDVGRPALASSSQNVVRIMSIHRSKGLEFPIVIVPDLGKRHNLQDAAGAILADRSEGLGMAVIDQRLMIRYPSLASILVANRIRRQTLAEEIRLLYVALTRAKEHLILVGTCGESQQEKWRSQWANHTGPLPADQVMAGRTMLDWLGPIAAMTAGDDPAAICMTSHPAADVAAWPNPHSPRPAFSERQAALAAMSPLKNPPPPDGDATQVIQHFRWVYPFESATHQPASASVTSLSKKAAPDSGADPISPPRKLELPRFFVESSAPKATDIGTATHLILQHWDFSKPADPREIERQIQSLVDRKLVTPLQAKMVGRESLQWMLGSEIGQLLAKHHKELMREIPFAIVDGPAGGDQRDRLMVRGRIDLLIPTSDGLILVDYKTDNVTPEQLSARRDSYAEQMKWYRKALETVARSHVAEIHLVFLSARAVMKV